MPGLSMRPCGFCLFCPGGTQNGAERARGVPWVTCPELFSWCFRGGVWLFWRPPKMCALGSWGHIHRDEAAPLFPLFLCTLASCLPWGPFEGCYRRHGDLQAAPSCQGSEVGKHVRSPLVPPPGVDRMLSYRQRSSEMLAPVYSGGRFWKSCHTLPSPR